MIRINRSSGTYRGREDDTFHSYRFLPQLSKRKTWLSEARARARQVDLAAECYMAVLDFWSSHRASGQLARLAFAVKLSRLHAAEALLIGAADRQDGEKMRSTTKTRDAAPTKRPSPPRLPQIESVRLYRQIADLLSTRIDQGLFPVGTFLPAERELSEQLGVSRTSVREALIALEVEGQVFIRGGSGVQVLHASAQANGAAQNSGTVPADIGPIQIMEARRLVEPKTAELAAANHTAANLKGMKRAMALQAQAESAKAPQYREGDRNFHVEIARASGNPAFEVLVSSLWEYRTKPLFRKFEEMLVGPDRPKKTAAEHRDILDAITARDGSAAAKAMKRHLDAVLRAFIKGTANE